MGIDFLSRTQFAQRLGISISTLDRGIRDQLWPFNRYVRIGRRMLFPIKLLQEIEEKALLRNPDKFSEGVAHAS